MTTTYTQKIEACAERLQDQIYLLQSPRGQRFASSMGLTVHQALALTAIELARLLNN